MNLIEKKAVELQEVLGDAAEEIEANAQRFTLSDLLRKADQSGIIQQYHGGWVNTEEGAMCAMSAMIAVAKAEGLM
jgi:hypothetical protein